MIIDKKVITDASIQFIKEIRDRLITEQPSTDDALLLMHEIFGILQMADYLKGLLDENST